MSSSSNSIDDMSDPFTPPRYNKDMVRLKKDTKIIATDSISPSPNDRIYQKNGVSSPSISLSRQKKEAAEERLISLFSAATKSFDSWTNGPGSLGNIKSMSSDESSERVDDFKVSGSTNHRKPIHLNTNKVMRPIPRRPNVHTRESPGVFTEIANLEMVVHDGARRVHDEIDDLDRYHSANYHYSQQLNIQVMDNFFVFRV
jgi:hypothetical protein